jgi:hypothetical protein
MHKPAPPIEPFKKFEEVMEQHDRAMESLSKFFIGFNEDYFKEIKQHIPWHKRLWYWLCKER